MNFGNASDEGTDSGQGTPLMTAPLRDGRTASVVPQVLRIGDEAFTLDRLQDARQIVPEPPTIAVRVAGRGLVEFTPVTSEQGRLLLDAIYRLRPDLRPAGFEPPAEVPSDWPSATEPMSNWAHPANIAMPSQQPVPRTFSPGQHAPGHPPYGAHGSAGALGASAASPDGRLTPYPRDAMVLFGATFRLYISHWREWLLLGLLAAGLPSLASGALQMSLFAVQGHNPWHAIDTSVVNIIPSHLPKAGVLLALVSLALLLIVAFLLTSAWQVAVLADAARRALLGEPLDVRGSLRAGLRRFVPVLLVTLAFAGAVLVAIGVPVGLLLLVTAQVGPNPSASTATLSAALSACLGLVWLAVGFVLVVYGAGRLALAPYLAATQELDPRAAILASWRLTKGFWWHVVLPLLGVGVVVLLISTPVGNVELISYGLEMLLAQPLANAVLSPLLAIAAVAILEDIRLRIQGYDAVLHTPFT